MSKMSEDPMKGVREYYEIMQTTCYDIKNALKRVARMRTRYYIHPMQKKYPICVFPIDTRSYFEKFWGIFASFLCRKTREDCMRLSIII